VKSVSIVIPVYNSEATIGDLCRKLISMYSQSCRLEIVLVNDCSRDRSDEICRRLHMTFPETVHYIRLARNFGEHNAVIAGLHHAAGDWCVIMDDDFQNPPEEVGAFLEMTDAGYDVIYARYEDKNDPWYRNVGSNLNNWLATRALGKPRDLYLSSFKAINRFLVDEIKKFTGSFPYIDAIILRSTSAIGTVLVRHDSRREQKSGYTWRALFALGGTMIIDFSLYPIRVIYASGFIMLLIAAGLFVRDAVHGMFPEYDPAYKADTLSAVRTLFRSVQLLATGIIGEYAGRLYLNSTNTPQFVIREQLRTEPSVIKGRVVSTTS
jgi:glycosyltransferase involved in cell wall biosynthesis